jgi:DNA topoisomerase IB
MRLRRTTPDAPGIRRRRHGRGFAYVDEAGHAIRDPEVLQRIRALVVPPAWTDVWICPQPNGHLQAVGTDSAGRRQYLYHEQWTERRDVAKHRRILDFAARLPRARQQVQGSLALRGMPAERALATSFRLLDHGFFRVGSENYTAAHGTYGLATLRRDHVTVRGDSIAFAYVAKGGVDRHQRLVDHDLVGPIRAMLRRDGGGAELLAWRNGNGWHDVRSRDINAYLREVLDGEFTAKDFRTWNATVLMAQALAVAQHAPDGDRARRQAIRRGVAEVATYLGNTPAVARRSYIDPAVIDCFLDHETVGLAAIDRSVGTPGLAIHGPLEQAVVALLAGNRRA